MFTVDLPPPINTERIPFQFDSEFEVKVPKIRTSSIEDIDMLEELREIEKRVNRSESHDRTV